MKASVISDVLSDSNDNLATRSTAMLLLNNSQRVGPVGEPLCHAPPALRVSSGLLSWRHAIQAQGELSCGTSSSLRVQSKSLPVDVFKSIAFEMVAGVCRGISPGEEAG